MPVSTEDRQTEDRHMKEREKPLEGPEMLGYTGDDVYNVNTPYREGQRAPHYLRPIEQLRQSRHMGEENPYERARLFEEVIRPRLIVPVQYRHMFPYHDANDVSVLEAYEKYKLSPERLWDDKEVRLYSYQVPWFATAMTDGKTVWLGPRGEFYSPVPDLRINHEDPGHPMTFIPGWTEDDVDIKGQVYAGVRSSNRIYTV